MKGSGTNSSHRFSGSIKSKIFNNQHILPMENKTHKSDTVTQKVIELCEVNHYTYGYRKITALINQYYTSPINHKRVQRMMQKHHLNCRVRTKKTTRIGKPYYKTDNLLQKTI